VSNNKTAQLLVILLLVAPLLVQPVTSLRAQEPIILIDGVKDAAWGDALALDPTGDMTEPNLDLQGLYVVEDAEDYFIGFDATASTWGMTYGIYLDTDQASGSGGTTDPWGRAISAVSTHLPERTLYVWHDGGDFLQDVQLNHWTGSGWTYDSLASQGGEQAYGPDNDWIEYRVPKAALGSPAAIALELFTTGGDGHAQDTVPSDPNVAYTAPDWTPGVVTTLSAFALFPPPSWYARGDWNAWGLADPMYDDGAHGDGAAGDGLYGALVTIAAAGRHEFKVATDDWSLNYPADNSWLETSAADEVVTVTLDTTVRADGWLPMTNIMGVSTEPGAWTAVGDWQGWNNANPDTAMADLGSGRYQWSGAIANPGVYQYKAVKTGTWDAVGADGRSVNASTVSFETVEAGQQATFSVDAFAGRVAVELEEVTPMPGLDDNIWWDGLGHQSRDDLYRVPGGAVPTGTPVTLRFRTYHNDVTDVTLRVWSTAAGAQTLYPMALVATTDDPPFGYDYWQATLPAQDAPTIVYYRFIVRDGMDEDYYEDDDLFDGGWGTAYEDSPDYSFQIDVYEAGFETPDWMKNAVVYQIFPDRFYNGDPKNDPKPTDTAVYDNPVEFRDWGELPEGYCRNYVDVICDEGPLGRDFFGGDLQGVKDKLDYLADLGVTAIYFNPIFRAPSNHLYDTTDYFRIDPYFGYMGTFQSLVNAAQERGIRLILDGVFNHTSSDSIYFDRYSRYPKDGAYESQDSRYYDWYTFYAWPDSYNSWWGFTSLPVLTEIPEVREFIFGSDRSVARWWIEQQAAGWRLDVAPDKSHDFWQGFRPSVKAVDPDAVIIGEIWDDASPWILGDELDTTMNYRFRRAMIGFLNGDTSDPNQGFVRGLNPDQFDSILQSIEEDYPPEAFQAAMNLVGSHDTQRILWLLTPGARNQNEKEDPENLAEGKARLKLLAILQMTMPGAPTVYYGDEVGLTGDTDPDDRRTFPWEDMDTALLAHYRALIALRNDHSALRTGSFERLYTHNDDGTYAYGRKDTSGAAVVAVNRDVVSHDLAINLEGYVPEGTVLVDGLNGGSYTVTGGLVTISVAAQWGAILITPPGTDLTPPEAPAGLEATAGDARVSLAWGTVADAAGYHVYRSPVSGGGYTRLTAAPLAETAFTDETVANGQLTYYVVTAVDAPGNESGASNEAEALPHMVIGWANLQWPYSIVHTISAVNPTENVYGRVWIDGHTALPGATEGLVAQLGYGPDGSNPDGSPEWIWVAATFNVDVDNNDEFKARLLPEAAGVYDYAYRYSTTAGREWLYADLDGTGNGYDPAQAGSLTVIPSDDTVPPGAPANLRLVEAAPTFVHIAWDAVADADLYRYEVYRGDSSGGPYTRLEDVLAPSTEYADWSVVTGTTYYYVVVATDTSFNASAYSAELEATAQARPVQVTFQATLPATTPVDASVYMGGSFNGWNPAGTLMARTDLLATVTLEIYEGDHLEYKYTMGNWETVEKGAECEEISNRVVTVVYGTDGTMIVDDTVLNWRNVLPCGD
jgi:glycosidase